MIGISNNALLIKKGSQDTATRETKDALLQGPGVNIGTGMDVYLDPNVSLDLGILYRFVNYTQADGVHGNGSIDKAVNGSGFSFLLAAVYHF